MKLFLGFILLDIFKKNIFHPYFHIYNHKSLFHRLIKNFQYLKGDWLVFDRFITSFGHTSHFH